MSQLTKDEKKILERILNPNEHFILDQHEFVSQILHDCNKLSKEEKKILKKEINQNVPFVSDQYEFILGQQIVQAAKELKLDCCVIKGLYISDFMPGFLKKDETLCKSKQSYELNDYEKELIKLLRIEEISEEKLEQMVLLHKQQKKNREKKFKNMNQFQKTNDSQNTDDTPHDKFIIKVCKKVYFFFYFTTTQNIISITILSFSITTALIFHRVCSLYMEWQIIKRLSLSV